MLTNGLISLASLSNIASVLSNYLGAFFVLGSLYPSSNKICVASAKLFGFVTESIKYSPEAFVFLIALK